MCNCLIIISCTVQPEDGYYQAPKHVVVPYVENTSYSTNKYSCVDKKNQLDVTFCILYFSSNSCSTCFGQPCAHHQELTTA